MSHGLFSSADIDTGTKFLLKVFSRELDSDLETGKPMPRNILDAGCGTGVLGICAAGAVFDAGAGKNIYVRCQDRDELARIFTEHNALRNNIGTEILESRTELLLAGTTGNKTGEAGGAEWDLILTNIPAKAGKPVLEDFVRRSAGMLNNGGKVFMVAVNTLAGFFRTIINMKAVLLKEETGTGHTVFIYEAEKNNVIKPAVTGIAADAASIKIEKPGKEGNFFGEYPAYLRTSGEYQMENTAYHLDAIHGTSDFDTPGAEIQAAAALISKIKTNADFNGAVLSGPALIHEGGPGHFPAWLVSKFNEKPGKQIILSGRNILALEAAMHNTKLAVKNCHANEFEIKIIPSVDLALDCEKLKSQCRSSAGFSLIAAFPEIVPMTDRLDSIWEGLAGLLAPGGFAVIGMSSTDAERLDRRKPPGFTRMGDIKRKGFRALAYRKN